ncbi:MAG: ATP-binding protein [Candidatus Hydrothermia bacterium]
MVKIDFRVLGNDYPKSVFANVILKEAFTPLYLLEGPLGVGKATLAHEVVAAALCEHSEIRPCRECANCKRVFSFNHPDFLVLAPEKSTLSPGRPHIRPEDFSRQGKITIAQVRAVGEEAKKPPFEAKQRFIVILDGDLMDPLRPEAQNAFLKTLEEGGASGRTTFLMVSSFPRLILPTILSRARRVRFFTLSLEDFSRYDFSADIPVPVLHRLSEGSIGMAKRFLGPHLKYIRKGAVAVLSGDREAMGQVISFIGRDRDLAETFLTVYCSLLRDARVIKEGASELVTNLDMRGSVEAISKNLSAGQIDELLLGARVAEEAILERYISAETALLAGFKGLFPRSMRDSVK